MMAICFSPLSQQTWVCIPATYIEVIIHCHVSTTLNIVLSPVCPDLKFYCLVWHLLAPCGFWVVRIDLLCFLVWCHKRWLNQVLSLLSLSIRFSSVLLFIRAPLCLWLFCVGICSVFSVVLVKLSILSKWLARKTPLRKPNHGERIISSKPRPLNERCRCCYKTFEWLCERTEHLDIFLFSAHHSMVFYFRCSVYWWKGSVRF